MNEMPINTYWTWHRNTFTVYEFPSTFSVCSENILHCVCRSVPSHARVKRAYRLKHGNLFNFHYHIPGRVHFSKSSDWSTVLILNDIFLMEFILGQISIRWAYRSYLCALKGPASHLLCGSDEGGSKVLKLFRS